MKKATWLSSVLLSMALCVTSLSGVWMNASLSVRAEEYYDDYSEEYYYEEEYYEESYDDSYDEGYEESYDDSNDEGGEDYSYEVDPTVDSNDFKDWPQGSGVDSDAAIVMDAESGAILYAKHIDAQKYPASITKIMTVLLALENGKLEDTVKFSEYAVYSIEFGSAHLGLTEGEELTLEQCLYGIMLASANEISNAVAEYVAGDVDTFAQMMNDKAASLGCTNTHFVNPNGLHDPDHYVSARDMALITREALRYDKFREIINTDEYHYPPTNLVKEDRYFVNHHSFLMDESYDGIIGGKTGYTDEAYNTLVTCAERDGMTLISVVLHAPGIESEYGDTRRILDYGFDNFEQITVNNAEAAKNHLEIVGIDDAAELEKIKSADYTQEPFAFDDTTTVIVPKGTDASMLSCKMDFGSNVVSYYYNDMRVGYSTFDYSGVWETETEAMTEAPTEGVTEAVTEEALPLITEAEPAAAETEKMSFMDKVQHFSDTMKQGFAVIRQLMEGNEYVAAILGGILLIIFVPLLILAIVRNIRYKKIMKVRYEEMERRKRLEEEIERKSAAQIEAELRARDLEYQREMEKQKAPEVEAESKAPANEEDKEDV